MVLIVLPANNPKYGRHPRHHASANPLNQPGQVHNAHVPKTHMDKTAFNVPLLANGTQQQTHVTA